MTPPLSLHRVTTLQDLEPLYHIGADAFRNDPGMNWFYPGGRDHPEDLVVAWKYLLLQEFFDKGKYILAASIPDPDQDDTSIRVDRRPGKVVGFAVWERRGASEAAKSWQGGGVLKGVCVFLSICVCACVMVCSKTNSYMCPTRAQKIPAQPADHTHILFRHTTPILILVQTEAFRT